MKQSDQVRVVDDQTGDAHVDQLDGASLRIDVPGEEHRRPFEQSDGYSRLQHSLVDHDTRGSSLPTQTKHQPELPIGTDRPEQANAFTILDSLQQPPRPGRHHDGPFLANYRLNHRDHSRSPALEVEQQRCRFGQGGQNLVERRNRSIAFQQMPAFPHALEEPQSFSVAYLETASPQMYVDLDQVGDLGTLNGPLRVVPVSMGHEFHLRWVVHQAPFAV